ncbi:MAG: hypothetical protein JRJ87_20410 [Deltaproteobacteria bacterium]|nr:hypothetical protein [Deltaproteobacteria bacterium]
MNRLAKWIFMAALPGLIFSCTSREKGTCEKDSHCEGAEVCFESKCITMKALKKLKEDREEAKKPKICKDNDGDGARAGKGCPKGELQDCNDDDPNMAPGKTEVCDAIDNDCDGMVNEDQKNCVRTLFGGATWGNQAEHRLVNPRSIVYDPAGFVLVTDNNHVWKIHLNGRAEIMAGSHLSNFIDGEKDNARFSYPTGLIHSGDGGVFVADCKNNCIRKVTATGSATTYAGFCSNLTKHTNEFADGSKDHARFYCPADVALTTDGSLIVVDRENARIRRVSPTGEVVTIAGVGPVEIEEGEGQIGFLDGPAEQARFNDPQAVLVDPNGIIYVSESFNCRIRRIDPKKGEHGEVSTLAGESDTLLGIGGFADGTGAKAKFSYPHGMQFDPKGNLIVADTGNSVIRLVTPAGKVKTLYGKPGEDKYVDGPIDQARFSTPTDLDLGPDGSLFVVDTVANRVRWIVPK